MEKGDRTWTLLCRLLTSHVALDWLKCVRVKGQHIREVKDEYMMRFHSPAPSLAAFIFSICFHSLPLITYSNLQRKAMLVVKTEGR